MAAVSIGDILLLLGEIGLDDQRPEARDRFRRMLAQGKWQVADLRQWIEECLQSGSRVQPQFYYALQDIVTSLGYHLGMEVEYGSYAGSQSAIAFDGRWTLANGQTILVEVKSNPWPLGSAGQLGNYMELFCQRYRRPPTEVFGLFAIGSGDFQPIIDQIKGSEFRNRQKVVSFEDLLRMVEVAQRLPCKNGQAAVSLAQNLLLPFESVNVGTLLDIITQVSESRVEAARAERKPETTAPRTGLFREPARPGDGLCEWQRPELEEYLDTCKPMQYALVMALAFSPQPWVNLDRMVELMQAATGYIPGMPQGYTCTPKAVGGARSGISKRQQQLGREAFIVTRGTRYTLHERYRAWIRDWLTEQGLVIPAHLTVEGAGGEVFHLFEYGEV
jgi:hypothetical protein